MKYNKSLFRIVVILSSVLIVIFYVLGIYMTYQQLRQDDYDNSHAAIETSVQNTLNLINDETNIYTDENGNVDDEKVKAAVYSILMDQKVSSNQYVWINEVINYDGGDNYAKIFLHQNTRNKVGSYLSTDITDAAGNQPYLSELEGIVKDGELWQTYYYKNYLNDQVEKKLSYAKLYKPYNWIVASGIPESDMYRSSNAYFEKQKVSIPFVIMIVAALDAILLLSEKYREEYHMQKLMSEKAKIVSETKSRFLANMSHEMRTPLNGIIGFTYLLKNSLDDPASIQSYVDKIDQSSHILLSIINDVLDISAIEAGKLKLADCAFSIKECIYSVTNLFYQQCKTKNIEYESYVEQLEYENLMGDSYRIRQILLNLLSNAVKFTEKGGRIKTTVTEEVLDGEKVALHLTVSDTGCGMSEEFQRRVFGEFEQENEETVREHGGSGLGLSIVKNLVSMMHGKINLHSKLGEGTTFEIILPLEAVKTETIHDIPDMNDLDILTVDDDEDACRYICSIAHKWGVKCEYILDPTEAVEKVKERIKDHHEYNVFILDMKMPGMDGVELSRKLHEIVSDDAVIMILSGYDFDEYRQEAKAAGVSGFLQKPVFPSELFDAIVDCKKNDGVKIRVEDTADSDQLKNIHILLAEDNEINQQVAKTILEHSGAVVSVADNGQQAVNLAANKKEKFDLILMDIRMPVKDGYQAAKEIRALNTPYTDRIPIIALTANSFQTDIEKSKAAGMNGHIGKPIDPAKLIQIIKTTVTEQNL